VDFWVSVVRNFCSFSAKELFRQAQCSVKVIIACFVEGCLKQTPSRVNIFVFATRRKRDFLRLLKTTGVLACSQRNILIF
jgi:hypothetical protein